MHITQLRLQNFRQHQNRSVDFRKAGCQLLVGENGSGKSGIVHAIKFAMSGSLPLNKKEFITWGQRTGSVELDFTCRDGEYTVIRSLHNSGVVLRNRTTNESIVGHADVNKRISSLLGTQGRLVESLLFQSQGEIDAFFRMRPADRTKYFHSLFDTERLSKLHASLISTSAGIQPFVVDLPPSLAMESVESLNRFTANLNAALATKASVQNTVASTDIEKLQVELNNALAWRMQVASIQQQYPGCDFQSKLVELKAVQSNAGQAVSNLNDKIVKVQADLAGLTSLFDSASQLQNNYRNQKMQWDRKCSAKQSLDAALSNPIPSVPEDLVKRVTNLEADRQNTLPEVAKHEANLNSLSALLQTFSQKDGCCPTCGTTKIVDISGNTQDLNSLVAKTKEFMAEGSEKLKAIREKYNLLGSQLTTARSELKAAQDAEQTAQRNLQHLKSMYEAMALVQDPGPEPVTADYKSELDAKTKELNVLRQSLFNTQNEYNKVSQDIEQLSRISQQYSELVNKLATVDFSGLESKLKTLIVQKQQLDECDRSIAVFTQEINTINGRLETLRKTQAKTKKARERLDLVETLRNIFHPSALPLEIVKRQTTALELLWNELLSILSVPFNILITQGLEVNFEYMTPVGKISTEAATASGGQQCCAGLALALAAHRLFCPEAGFVVLDEPTYGLDANHVELVGDLFDKLESYAESNKLQILLVSHESTLKDKFKSVIHL